MVIKQAAFRNCKMLRKINLPDTLFFIEDEAFLGCEKLEVTIPQGTEIGPKAIYGTLTYVKACEAERAAEQKKAEEDARWKAEAEARRKAEEEGASRYLAIENGKVMKYNGPGGRVIIPHGVESIGDKAFSHCAQLTEIIIPNSVKRIGDWAFYFCRGLTKLTIPDSVKWIGELAFSGCTGLTKLTIPDSVKRIGAGAFSGCTGLTEITIPNSVESIGMGACYGCYELKNVFLPRRLKRAFSNAIHSEISPKYIYTD